MSISISNNLYSQSYNPTTKKNKAETSSFTMPDVDEQIPSEASDSLSKEVSDALSKEKPSEEDTRIICNYMTSHARALPQGIGMNEEQFLAYHESKTAKIVFEFGEDGSTRIKEGLSPADYARAKAALRDYEFWLSGGTLSR